MTTTALSPGTGQLTTLLFAKYLFKHSLTLPWRPLLSLSSPSLKPGIEDEEEGPHNQLTTFAHVLSAPSTRVDIN